MKSDLEKLFQGWDESIIWSCLQGVMGEVYTNNKSDAAAAMLGDFAFYAGRPCEELIMLRRENCERDFVIMVPQNPEWSLIIEKCYGENAKKVSRYATRKTKDVCRKNSWSNDFVSRFENYDMYKKLGLGVVVYKDGELAAGASSYSRYNDGIEIEIDTRQDCRRKGLAYACSAKLILECLERGLYPSWDAQNKSSLALAVKLGYQFSHEYTAYEVYR